MSEIIVFGGGKGGTGKSSVALNYATRLAEDYGKTVIIDIDLGAANLHTMLGLHNPQTGISEFLFDNKSRKNLAEFAIETSIPDLHLISAASFTPGMANIEYQRKQKILNAIKKLDYEYIVCDLGAGSNFNTIDFFEIADKAFLVTLPEPTALLNSYEFLKNFVFRQVKNIVKADAETALTVKAASLANENLKEILEKIGDKPLKEKLDDFFKNCNINLIMNKTPNGNKKTGIKLQELSKQYLQIELNYLGNIEEDKAFSAAIAKGKPAVTLNNKIKNNIDKIMIND